MQLERISTAFAALGDPTRLAILSRLSKGEASVTELAKPFSMSMPAITKHLKVLEHAGLITRGREAQWRPCRIEAAGFQPATHWIEEHRKIWEERFDRLDDYIQEFQKQETKEKRRGRKKHRR